MRPAADNEMMPECYNDSLYDFSSEYLFEPWENPPTKVTVQAYDWNFQVLECW